MITFVPEPAPGLVRSKEMRAGQTGIIRRCLNASLDHNGRPVMAVQGGSLVDLQDGGIFSLTYLVEPREIQAHFV